MTTEQREQQEPSMEEILSSIRRIIADEEAEDANSDEDPELGAAEARAAAFNEDADALADAANEEPDDVLELTKVVREGGEVVDMRGEGSAGAGHELSTEGPSTAEDGEHELELAPFDDEPAEEQARTPQDHAMDEDQAAVATKQADVRELVSTTAASAATGAFAKLSHALRPTPPEESVADDSGRTVEQFIEDIIRPMLKDWLDENLPPIIERLVEKEIKKISRRAELM